ncbi:MAG: DUF418 domain-containing protein [Longimicrobiales bacterium]
MSIENTAAAAPVRERIQALDVLRGVAVGGILLANVLVFFGLTFLPAERAAAMSSASRDSITLLIEHVFVDGKFYSVFSLLFGIGFGVQLSRGGDAALPRFKRRLRILLGIGAVHALLVWAGDILLVYALLGFTLPWFERKTDRELLRGTVIMLAIPTALYIIGLVPWMLLAPNAAPPAPGGGMPPSVLGIFEAIGTGGFKEALIGNLVFFVGRWLDLVATVRFPKVLGMFVLGLWAVRTGIALRPEEHRAVLRRWCLLGWGIGLPANIAATWAGQHWAYLPPSAGGLFGVIMAAIGVPMLALGYATTVALLVVNGWRIMRVFAPVGRMALTNYLMQSAICVLLTRGFGFGLWWQVGATAAMGVAAAVFLVQILASTLWLSRFRFGPAEWVWRRLTYGRPI